MNNLAPGSVVAFYNEGRLCIGFLLSLDQSRAHLLCNTDFLELPESRLLIFGPTLKPEPSPEEAYHTFQHKILSELDSYDSSKLDQQLTYETKYWTELVWPDKTEEFLAFLYSREHPDLYAWKKSSIRLRSWEERERIEAERFRKSEYSNWLERVKPQLQAMLDGKAFDLDSISRASIISELHDHLLTGKHSGLIGLISSLSVDEKLEELILRIRIALKDLDQDSDPILAGSGLPVGFPPDLNTELSTPKLDGSIIKAFSIDEEDSCDLDDAISLEESEEGYCLGIHISDLASRISPHSELFQIAKERVSSLYLTPGVTPLLPFELSHDTLSLREGKLKPCLSLSLHIDKNFHVKDWHFHHSWVEIYKNYSYREVDRALDQEPFCSLHKICRALSDTRDKQNPEQRDRQIQWYFKLSGDRIVGRRIDFGAPSRQMVEELMVCYNSLFASHARALNLPLLFRNVSNTGNLEERQNSKAYLSTQADYHPGIGVAAYAHATSPIRRFTDLVNQMQMQKALTGEEPLFGRNDLDSLIPGIEEKLLLIREIAQASDRYWFLCYLKQDYLNDPLPAIVSKQIKNSTWLELPNWGKKIQVRMDTQAQVGEELQVVLHEIKPETGLVTGYLIS